MLFLAATNPLTWPDYLVIVLYLIVTLVIGISFGMRMKTGTDFFLAGRQLPWWAIGMSLVATDIGGTDIIGVGGAAYSHGLAVANFEWIGCIPAMIVGAFIFIPFFYRTGVSTVPEFLERRYSPAVRIVMAGCWLLFMACNLGIMLLASAKMTSALFGWNELACIVGMALLVGCYTFSGGLSAVVYTDVVQCVVMIAGCLLILVLGLVKVGGIGALQDRLTEVESRQAAERTDGPRTDRTSLVVAVDTPSPFPWPGIYFGLAWILSPAYWIGNQAIVQRSLGARSEFEAKASYVWGAMLKNLIPLIIAVPGLIAAAILPNLPDGDTAIPHLVGELLPAGLRGMFVAAFLAALMSSIDSYVNSAATILANDVYQRFVHRSVTAEQLLTVGRVTTVALVAWAIAFALLLSSLSNRPGIYAIFQTLMAFFQGPALAILLFGIFWRRATAPAALVALLCGIGTSILLYAMNQPAVYESLGWQPLFQISEPFLYFSCWAFLVSAVMLVVLSLFGKPVPPAKLRYLFGGEGAASVSGGVTSNSTATPGGAE